VSVQLLQAHWGFTKMPFGRDLAPSMLHRYRSHQEAIARITWCIEQHHIGVITGEVGAGKTVAIRAATTALDTSRHVSIYLANPAIGVRGLLHHIVAALGTVPSFYTATLVAQATDALAGEHAERGRTPVLIIDEAHLLDHAQMEAVRMLTNHDMDSGSPLATLLVGQPTLRQKMRLSTLAALDQRIGMRYAMPPMSDTETRDYIHHHIKLAGRTDTLFTDDAITVIHTASRGYPRAINNIAVHALTAAYARTNPVVDEKAARAALAETITD
jgi:type II secretory pathway predicted ATPase ExeA